MESKSEKPIKIKTKRRAHLPKTPFNNIAISLSGGGFRATSIHLGLMSYLSSIKLNDISLLEKVRVLSSVSGGTFLGVKYATTIKKGGTFKDCYNCLFDLMTKQDLVEDALQYLAKDDNWQNGKQRSLINAFAAVYYEKFESETFGLFWNEFPSIHLKEISFNATEFNFGFPFHFQKTELTSMHPDDQTVEHIGNKKIHIPINVAKEIRLSDIIAASSCVPFGFEPINFPDDFIYPGAINLKNKALLPTAVYDGEPIEYPIGLMDGGVDDNQGVDAIINAEERMKNYSFQKHEFRSHDKKSVDLYIISDGTNPNMKSYKRSKREKIPFIGNWSFKLMQHFGITSFIVGVILLTSAFFASYKLAIISLSISGTLGILIAAIFLFISRGFAGLTRLFGIPVFFRERMQHVDKLKFGTLNNLLLNRRNSVVKMISKVFIKQMRWFGFERVYGDIGWQPRLIMNAIFELTADEVEKRKKKYPYLSEEIIEPGEKIMAVSEKALKKGTTLWFTEDELNGQHNLAESIIACGQFTICFNLLEYFEKFLKNKKYQSDYDKYSPETKIALDELQKKLLIDWKKFKSDPYWMVKELKEQK